MVRDNILQVKRRISLACSKVNREAALITIVAVSKGRTPSEIIEAINAGITDIGENRVQEAEAKYEELVSGHRSPAAIRWHMVGHLQTNKVKDAVRIFDVIHSVDSVHLAQELDKQAARIDKVQDILIEIKTSPEATKFGVKPEETIEVIKQMGELKNINIKGLMTIAPIVDNPEKTRPYFKTLRELRDRINAIRNTQYAIRDLSMGMTDDFEAAIEEGATMVRIGRAIFKG